MELVNSTPLPSELRLSSGGDDRDLRQGLLLVKATFEVDRGRLCLVDDDPVPILDEDLETELGVLPLDVLPREGPEVELSVLARAYAPDGRPTSAMTVEMTVGTLRWTLSVTGDRYWSGEGRRASISAPVPFTTMPITWARAFGGTADVELDPHTFVEIPDTRNPLGRGFDPGPMARALAQHLGVPSGYPRWDPARPLPNVEHPRLAVRAFDDSPLPFCWAPRPLGQTRPRYADHILAGDTTAELDEPMRLFRCMDAQILPSVPFGAPIELRGVTPSGVWGFELPRLEIVADYVIGERTGSRTIQPNRIVLLPDESRFYLAYQKTFFARVTEHEERSMRLRMAY